MAERKRKIEKKVFLSEYENQRIRENMGKLKITNFSLYSRKMLCDGYIIERDMSLLKELTNELARISRTLNSLARRANITQSIYREDLADISKGYRRARAVMKTAVEKIKSEYENGS